MKYFVTLMLLLSVMVFAGDKKDQAHTASDKADKMACELADGEACTGITLPTAHCACGGTEKMIGKALNGVDGVTLAQVDVKTQMAHVHYKADKTTVADMEKAVAGAGFAANETKADQQAQSQLHACCAPKAE